MKLNVSYPATGCQKLFEIADEHKLRIFYEKRMGAEVEADSLGDEWKGYIVRIAGGNDKQGFPMKQGVLTNGMMHSGIGFTNFNEILACLNIPTIDFETYKRYEAEIGNRVEEVAKESCLEAALEERNLTLEQASTIQDNL